MQNLLKQEVAAPPGAVSLIVSITSQIRVFQPQHKVLTIKNKVLNIGMQKDRDGLFLCRMLKTEHSIRVFRSFWKKYNFGAV